MNEGGELARAGSLLLASASAIARRRERRRGDQYYVQGHRTPDDVRWASNGAAEISSEAV